MSSKKNKTQKKINKKKVFIALTICILVALIGGVSVLAYGVYKDTETFDAKKLLSSGASVLICVEDGIDSSKDAFFILMVVKKMEQEKISPMKIFHKFLLMLLLLLKILVSLNIMVLTYHVLLKQLCLI